MSLPPPPDPFGSHPTDGGGHPGMPPQWGPQQQWAANPQPGPGRGGGGKTKWILGGLVVALAIALAVVITVVLVRPDNNSDNTPNDGAPVATSEFASANDTGPITIITEDPSCAAWLPILNTLADSEKNGWADRDPAIPASAWSPEQRAQYHQVGQAMRAAADQSEPMIKLTTHRVMRELYEQFIVYARAYADAIPTYTERDNALARTATQATHILANICQAISFGSAAARDPLVPGGSTPADPPRPRESGGLERFMLTPDPVCLDVASAADQFEADTADWRNGTSVNIPAGQWSPEQKALNHGVIPRIREWAQTLDDIGLRSDNATLQDLSQLGAQYLRAYAQALPTYSVADQYLYQAGLFPAWMIRRACEATGG